MMTKTPKKKPTCPNWQILLGEYVLGTITERDRARLEDHLSRCRRCRRALAETEDMYRLLGDFELAKANPFFAAKVERALTGEAGVAGTAEAAAEPRNWFRGWLRAPAFISAAAAAAAIVVGVLYVKVWMPGSSEPIERPPAKGAVPPAASVGKADRVLEAEGKKTRGVAGRVAKSPALKLEATEEALAESPAADEFTTYDAAVAAAPPVSVAAGREEEAVVAEEAIADFDALMRGETVPGGGALGAAPRGYARTDAKASRLGAPGTVALTAADVEGWMDERFEADVEKLTGDDGVLLDYVTPNGLLMAYFYELPLEEQRMLLSRIRRETEETSAAEMLLSR
jgi:hypothetical protein